MRAPKNILWLSFEDTNPRFGCYGDPVAKTPHMDQLASESCRYDQAFSVAGVCAPSRCAIITGMYPTAIGAHHMRTQHRRAIPPQAPEPYECVPPHYVKCFPEYLRAAGWFCTNNDKTDYQFKAPSTAWDENHAEAHWRHRKQGQPFFAVFNFTLTHESGMWADKGGEPVLTDPNEVVLPPYLRDTDENRKALARHYDQIHQVDAKMGELLKQLEEDGEAEETLVVVWSDHGAGLLRSKRWPYDSGIRIPLIVRWPGGLEPGTTSDQLVSLIDLPQTMMSLVGVDPPRHLQGQPFLGPEAEEREYVFATRDRYDESYDMIRATRDKRYKYLRNEYRQSSLPFLPYQFRHANTQELMGAMNDGTLTDQERSLFLDPRQPEELYDCEADPWEQENLAKNPEHRSVLLRMREALDQWMQRYDRFGPVDETAMLHAWWAGPTKPQTHLPALIPLAKGQYAEGPKQPPVDNEAELAATTWFHLYCGTQGASIEWRLDSQPSGEWQLYSRPFQLPPGETTLRARAIRIGFEPSEERVVQLTLDG